METCEICKVQPARTDDILCKECSDHYANLLKSARSKTRVISVKSSEMASTGLDAPSELSANVAPSELSANVAPSELSAKPALASQYVGYVLLGIGLIALAAAVLFSSTILTFIGLGLAFWGMLAFFARPQKYVKDDLMNATAQSSLRTIDNMLIGLEYRERGVYIPVGSEKAVVFIPAEPFSKIPQSASVEGKTFLNDPEGLLVVPPGLALASLIEKKLGFKLKNCGMNVLIQALPKVLVEDLEIVRDVEIDYKGDTVNFKLVGSIYADFCREVRDSSRRCGLGCPMCSALACILTMASGKPVLFEEDKSLKRDTTESSYTLLNEGRL